MKNNDFKKLKEIIENELINLDGFHIEDMVDAYTTRRLDLEAYHTANEWLEQFNFVIPRPSTNKAEDDAYEALVNWKVKRVLAAENKVKEYLENNQ